MFDLTIADGNVFFFFPPDNSPAGFKPKPNKLKNNTTRWVFDPKAKNNSWVEPFEEIPTGGEFSRIDDRFVTRKVRIPRLPFSLEARLTL